MIPYENWGHIGASTPPARATAAERRIGLFWLICISAMFLALALLTSCAGSRAPLDTPEAPTDSRTVRIVPPQEGLPGRVDSSSVGNLHTAHQPAPLQRLTDAIGLSTPEGRARRQAVRLAKAAAPKLGKGAVYAVNSQVSNGFKAKGPVTQADSGAVVSNAAENSQQQNVKGDDNTLTADKHDTTQQAKDWKAELASPVGKVVAGVAGLIIVATCLYGFVLWRKKKQAQSLIS